MNPSVLLNQKYINFSVRLTLLLTTILFILSESEVNAKEVDSTLAQWQPWEGSTENLCVAKPLYCGCGGYYKPPEASTELDDTPEAGSNSANTFIGVADQYSYSLNGIAEMLGNVVIKMEDLQVNAEKMSLNDKEQTADFEGDVRLSLPGFRLSGPYASISTAEQKARIEDAGLIVYQNGLRGHAEEVEIDGKKGVTIRNGEITSCTPGNESWMLVGNEIDLNLDEGWGTVHHMRIEVGDIPIVYVPYFTFPLDDRRKSGFLVPQFDLAAPDISVPYYWNIAPNYDMTLTPRYIGNRGNMLETEFRYLTENNNGILNVDALPKDARREAADLDPKRGRFEWKHQGYLADNWDYDINVDYVSDPDYFVDFGNTLNSQTELFLSRSFDLRYMSPNWTFLTRFQGYQVLDTELADENYPYRRMPEIQLDHFDRVTENIPLFWDNRFSYTYFEQPKAIIPTAHRLTWNSVLSAPFTYFWGEIEPKVELSNRIYSMTDANGDTNSYDYTIPSYSVDTKFSLRKDSINNKYWQTLEPRIFYTYTPYKDQSDIPLFDTSELTLDYDQLFLSNPYIGGDRVADRQQLSLGLSSRLFEEDTGRMVLRGDIGQGFVTGDHTPIITRLVFSPQERLYWTNQINWQDGQAGLYSASTRINYVRPREMYQSVDAYSFEYRYRQEDGDLESINQYEISFAHTLNEKLKLLGKLRYDNREQRSFEHLVGFTYTGCCWEASLIYHRLIETDQLTTSDLKADQGILFEISLKSLGGLGGGLKDFLQEQIPGFEPRGSYSP